MANIPIEIQFAQSLAGNEKKVRDKAVKKIKKYLRAKSSSKKDGFSTEDFLKIWKGLHYCMWMQDKAVVQEELSVSLTQLLHDLATLDAKFLFVRVFFMTEAREWNGIDVWRIDKFMMMVRNMLTESLILLKNQNWKEVHMMKLMAIYGDTLMNPVSDDIPDGLRIHFADIYLDEVEKVGGEKLDGGQLVKLLDPFIKYLQRAPNTVIARRVISRVFEPIISRAVDIQLGKDKQGEEEEETSIPYLALKFNNKLLAAHLFEVSKQEGMLTRNRPLFYDIVKQLQDVENGVVPKGDDTDIKGVKDGVSKTDVNKAVHSLMNFENSLRKKKKAKKRNKNKSKDADGKENNSSDQNSNNNNSPSVYITPEHSEATIGKNTKGKRKLSSASVSQDTGEPLTKIKKKNTEDVSVKPAEDKITLKKMKEKFDCLTGKSKKDKKNKEGSLESISGKKSPKPQTSTAWTVTPSVTSAENKGDNNVGVDNQQHKTSVSDSSETNGNTAKSKKLKDSMHVTRFNVETKTPEKEGKHKVSIKSVPKITISHADSTQVTKASSSSGQEEGEVEIWVPNKKYKGNKDKKSPFASFDNSKPPSAFVKRALSKIQKTPVSLKSRSSTGTPKTAPNSATSETGSEKRVSFNMKNNKSQGFKESLKRPLTPYNPTKTPDSGILKSPVEGVYTPVATGQRSRKSSTMTPVSQGQRRKSTNSMTTPVISIGFKKNAPMKRAKAADFFL